MAPEIAQPRRKSALRHIWVRRNFVTGITLLVILLGSLIVSFHPVRYTATAVVAVNGSGLAAETPAQEKIMEQIVSILRSNDVLLPLIEKNGYRQRAAFNPALYPQETVYGRIRGWFTENNNLPLNHRIAEKIRKDTAITANNDHTVQIAFTSVSPDLAPKVANALAETLTAHPERAGTLEIRQKAAPAESFSEPDIGGTLGTSGLLGIIAGIALAYLMALTQTKKQEAAYVR